MALGTALSVSGLLVAVAWSSADTRYSQSALAHVVPGGPSLTTALDDLRDPPPLLAEATEGESLLDEYLPDEPRSIVLTSADLSVEILMRAERGSAVPLGDPWEDSFVPEQHLDPLEEFVDDLEAGDRALLDAGARGLRSLPHPTGSRPADGRRNGHARPQRPGLPPEGGAPRHRSALRPPHPGAHGERPRGGRAGPATSGGLAQASRASMYTVPALRRAISTRAATTPTGVSSTPAAMAARRWRAGWSTPRAPSRRRAW